MREFFRGWRRKAGCTTLVVALVFMAIWIRSRHITDTLTLRSEESRTWHSLTLSQQGLKWARSIGSGQHGDPEFMNISWTSDDSEYAADYRPLDQGWDIDWNWQCCGFQFGEYYFGSLLEFEPPEVMTQRITLVTSSLALWTVPYWSIVLPLTALSAWLLLSKPRKATRNPSEPTSTIGTGDM
jgi:hypothetical protein